MAERKRPPLYKKGESISPKKKELVKFKLDPSGAERSNNRYFAGIHSAERREYSPDIRKAVASDRARSLYRDKAERKFTIGADKDVPKEIRAKAVRKLGRDMNRLRSIVPLSDKSMHAEMDRAKIVHMEMDTRAFTSKQRDRQDVRANKILNSIDADRPLKRTMPKTRALLRGVGKSLGGPAGAAMIGIDAYQQIKQSVEDMNLKSKPKKKKK